METMAEVTSIINRLSKFVTTLTSEQSNTNKFINIQYNLKGRI